MKVILIPVFTLALVAGLPQAAMALSASECQARYVAAQRDGSLHGQTRAEFEAANCASGTAAAGPGAPVPSTLASPTNPGSAAKKIVPSGDRPAPTSPTGR